MSTNFYNCSEIHRYQIVIDQGECRSNSPCLRSHHVRVNLVDSLFLVGRAHWFAWIATKTNKKKMATRTDAIALSRPHSPMIRGQRSSNATQICCTCCIAWLRQCRNSRSSVRLTFTFFSLVEAAVVLTTKTDKAPRNRTTTTHGG